jgi:hypothetical protein
VDAQNLIDSLLDFEWRTNGNLNPAAEHLKAFARFNENIHYLEFSLVRTQTVQPNRKWLRMAWSGPHDHVVDEEGKLAYKHGRLQRSNCCVRGRGMELIFLILLRANQAETVYLVPRAMGIRRRTHSDFAKRRQSVLSIYFNQNNFGRFRRTGDVSRRAGYGFDIAGRDRVGQEVPNSRFTQKSNRIN